MGLRGNEARYGRSRICAGLRPIGEMFSSLRPAAAGRSALLLVLALLVVLLLRLRRVRVGPLHDHVLDIEVGNRSVLGPASNAAQSNADAISMKCSVFSMGAACIYGCARNNVGAFQFAYESCLFTAVANGSLILNWAQASTNATGTILGANSWGRMVQLA